MAPLAGVLTRRERPLPPARAGYPTLFALILLTGCASAPTPQPAALPALEARVNASPADAESALRLGLAYRAAQRGDDARVLLERATANITDEPRLVLLLGLVYEDLGRFADARALYRRYLDSSSPDLRREVAGRLPLLGRAELRAAARTALAHEAELTAARPSASTLAVFPFLVDAPDSTLRPLGRALAEMLTTDLAQSSRLSVLERARVQALLDEAQLSGDGLTQPGTAVRGGRLLAAGTVVNGRVSGEAPLRMEALLAAAGADGGGPTIAREAALASLLDEEKELALGIYAAMGVELTPAERERVTRRATRNVQALLVFGTGLEAFDRGDYPHAARLFDRAAALDPAFEAARRYAAESHAAAAALSTDELAALLLPDERGRLALDPGDLAPLPLGREPTSEAAGTEGFTRPRTTVEIIITRP